MSPTTVSLETAQRIKCESMVVGARMAGAFALNRYVVRML